jgi:CheY-like chemotaxis protein
MIDLVFGIDDDETASFIAGITIKRAAFAQSFKAFNFPTEVINYFENQRSLPESEQKAPKLIFLDLQMPLIDGWEFLDIFQKDFAINFPDVKFIILSSSVDPDDSAKAKSSPSVIGFYQKPVKVELLNGFKQSDHFKRFFE